MSFWKSLLDLLKKLLNTEIQTAPAAPPEKPPELKPPSVPTTLRGSVEWYEMEYKNCVLKPNAKQKQDLDWCMVKLLKGQERFEKIANELGVPWALVAVLQGKEASFDWTGCIHNGERIIGTNLKTTIVPIGRGPFATWEDSVRDSFKHEGILDQKKWSLGLILKVAERYNGMGYFNRGLMSPYLWAGTTNYVSGLFWPDHVFNPDLVSNTAGCVAMLKGLEAKGISLF